MKKVFCIDDNVSQHEIEKNLTLTSESIDDDLRNQYNNLMEITHLLLREIDCLNQSFNALIMTNPSKERKKSIYKKIEDCLEVTDILRSAIHLGKTPNEMIGYYLLGAKHQLDKQKYPEEHNEVSPEKIDRQTTEEAIDEVIEVTEIEDPSIEITTKKMELNNLNKRISSQIDDLRQHFETHTKKIN